MTPTFRSDPLKILEETKKATPGSEVEADLLSLIETRTVGDADDEAIRATVQFAALLPHWNDIITPQIWQ